MEQQTTLLPGQLPPLADTGESRAGFFRNPFLALLAWRRAWLGMDKNPRALAFVQSRTGAVLLHVLFFGLLTQCWLSTTQIVVAVVALTACLLFPQKRLQAVGIAGVLSLLAQPFRDRTFEEQATGWFAHTGFGGIDPQLQIATVAAVFLLACWAALSLQERFPGNPLGRRPLVAQFAAMAALVAVATSLPLTAPVSAALWTFIGIYASSFWPLAYAFANLKTKGRAPPELHIGYLRPFPGGYLAPIGKGVGFLRKFEAQDAAALAATRLKALKLLVWALILQKANVRIETFVNGELGIPKLHDALIAQAHGHAVEPHIGWAILLTTLFIKIMYLAATGHIIVAMIRLAGFGIPRNTAKPFASRTLAEFWNRYYYYFKEILVDFFFYPAFTRFFKKSPRLRVAFATFCAAGVGNVLYHFLYLLGDVPQHGLVDVLYGLQSYVLYTVVLSAGIILSQLTNARPKPEDGFLRYEVLPRVTVILFFCTLEVFDDLRHGVELSTRFAYLFNLVGV